MRRNSTRLLRQVGGKPHASDADHEDPQPATRIRANAQLATPASSGRSSRTVDSDFKMPRQSEEDINAEPMSSEDEPQTFKHATVPTWTSPPEVKSDFKRHAQLDGPVEAKSSSPFKVPSTLSPPLSAGSKRTAEHASSDDSDDFQIFSSQTSQSKRAKKTYDSNIHASSQSRIPKHKAGYGKDVKRKQTRKEDTKAAELEQAKEREEEEAKKRPGAGFRLANIPDVFEFRGGASAETAFKQAGSTIDTSFDYCEGGASNSSELSDVPPDVEDEDVSALGIPSTGPGPRTTECAICSAQVPVSVREDFEDSEKRMERWTYKWQQRFCLYHRKASALELKNERGYPDIDWDRLPARLKQGQHMRHVKAILDGDVESAFRKEFYQRTKGGRNKTAQQLWDKKEDAGIAASTGYYGPRGEKVMADHILTAFSADLRAQATKDKLLATSGVAGGVSGFLQAVLVPELALSLMREDLGTESKRDGMEVLAESAELGELLHPEIEDQATVPEEHYDDDNDDGYGMET